MSLKLVLLSLVAAVSAINLKRQLLGGDVGEDDPREIHFQQVCFPHIPGGKYIDFDWTAPCSAVLWVYTTCTVGVAGFESSNSSQPLPTYPPVYQRDCFCKSQWFDAFEGCIACADKHGLSDLAPRIPGPSMASFSSSWCAAAPTATYGINVALADAFMDQISAADAAATMSATTSYSDALSNATEESNYYTPSVTPLTTIASSTAASGDVPANVVTATTTTATSSGATATAVSRSSSGWAPAITPSLQKLVGAGAFGLVAAGVLV